MRMDLGRPAAQADGAQVALAEVSRAQGAPAQAFHVVIIKPTHYDDDGYPIQWFRSAIPSNTLACLNGLAEDARRRNVLGPDVEIHLQSYDETNRRVRPERIIRTLQKAGGRALIGLVGVQSNQFPASSGPPGCRSASAASTFPGALPCCRKCPRTCAPRRSWA